MFPVLGRQTQLGRARQDVLPQRRWTGWMSDATIGPITLALFAYAGQIKASPLLSWVPVDLTLLLGLAVSGLVIASRRRAGPASGSIAIPIGLLAILQLGLVQSSFTGYAFTKVTTLWTFTALSVLAPFYLLREDKHRSVFLGTLVVLAAAVSAVTIARPSAVSTYTNVAIFEGSNTIGTARMTSTGLVICVVFMMGARVPARKRLILAALSLVLVKVALDAGSRGPFLAVGFGVLGVLVTSPAFRRVRGRALLATAILGSATFAWASTTDSDGAKRVLDFLAGQQNGSSLTREFFWSKSLDYMGSSPLGIGWGDFSQLPGIAIYANAAGAQYAHNLVLETFVEGGWLVGCAVLLYLVASTIRTRWYSVTSTSAAMYAILLFTMFNALVYGDINESRLLWMLLSCAWLAGRTRTPRDRPVLETQSSGAGPVPTAGTISETRGGP